MPDDRCDLFIAFPHSQWMETGRLGQRGHHVLQRAAQRPFSVRLPIDHFRTAQQQTICVLVGTRNCTGADNGGVCIGSALDTQLCDTNVSCIGKSSQSRFHPHRLCIHGRSDSLQCK